MKHILDYNEFTDEVKKEIEDIIGIPAEDAPCISAKTGLNVDEVLERIVTDIPSPKGDVDGKLQDELKREKRWLTEKKQYDYVSTLYFPLQQAGDFKSRITNFKVENFIR